jgi:hypothetical protein
MKLTPPEEAGTSREPKYTRQSKPQPTATTNNPASAPPAMKLSEAEEPKQKQGKVAKKAAKAERKAAPKAAGAEKEQQALERDIAKKGKREGVEARTAAEASKVPQTTEVSIYFVCTGEFPHDPCSPRLQRLRVPNLNQ